DTATTEIYPLSLHDALPISVPAVWQRHPHPPAILPALSRPRSAPRGQLMISPSPNSLALRRCLPGRAYSSCAHTPSYPAVFPLRRTDAPSPPLLPPLRAPLRPPIRPLGR